jgi:hypothetical protein
MSTTETQNVQGTQAAFPAGQRLRCDHCGSEIEIIKPCTCQPPDQILRCCGRDMHPAS